MGFERHNSPIYKMTDSTLDGKKITLEKIKTSQYLKNDMQKKRFLEANSAPKKHGAWHPQGIKMEVAAVYAVLRDVEKTHLATGIDRSIIRMWAKQPWFDEIVRRVVKEKNEVLDAALTDAIHKAVDVIIDRIDNGDFVYEKGRDGDYIRLPLHSRAAVHALEILFKNRQLLRGEATSRTEEVTEESKLKLLQENFERLASSKGINTKGEVIDSTSETVLEPLGVVVGEGVTTLPLPEEQNRL